MNGSNMDGTDAPKKQEPYRKPPSRRLTRRCIFIIVAVLILCLVICIVLSVELRRKSDDCPKGLHCDWRSMPHSEFLKDERCDSLCTTRPCIRSAQYVLSRMDSSMDPCEDFYEFACGTYEKQTAIFPDQNKGVYTAQEMENEVLLNVKEIIDSIDENPGKSSFALRLTKKLYEDCMETDNHADVLTKQVWKELFSENGRLPWPLISENTRNDQKHFVRMMASTLIYGVNPFFTLRGFTVESMNKKEFLIIRIGRTLGMRTLKSIYKNDSDLQDEENLLARYALILGTIWTTVGLDIDDINGIMPNIIEVEKQFLELTTKALEANDKVYENNPHLSFGYHNHSCQDLDHSMGNIKWCELGKLLRKEYGFPADNPIRIELPTLGDYFAAVNTVLGHHLDRDIINYIGVKFMFGLMKYMPSPLREIYYREEDIFPEKSMSFPLTARWQQCVDVVAGLMLLPIEKEYLRRNLDEKAREKIRNMVKEIKETHLSLLEKMSWLKANIKGDPKKVVRSIQLQISRSDDLLKTDEAALDRFYSLGFAESEEKGKNIPFILDALHMLEFREKLPVVAATEDAQIIFEKFFSPTPEPLSEGIIDLSFRFFVFPMYYPGRPMYAEYANLGHMISTHIMHILLMKARPQNGSEQALKNAVTCLSEQSHLYKTEELPYQKNQLGDFQWMLLLVHAMSTQASFQSYLHHLNREGNEKGLPGLPFTNEQLFFISAAQAHCEKFTEKGDFPEVLVAPARFRVNVPFAHMKEFSEAFRCPADSSMNLKRRCCILGDGKLSRDCK